MNSLIDLEINTAKFIFLEFKNLFWNSYLEIFHDINIENNEKLNLLRNCLSKFQGLTKIKTIPSKMKKEISEYISKEPYSQKIHNKIEKEFNMNS